MKICTALVAMALLLAAAPFALAANGDGVVVEYKPNVVSTGESVSLEIELMNDATDGKCIDEILIMPPDNWTGTAVVDEYSRSTFTYENKESNDNVTLVSDSQSVRIVPDNFLCVGETVEIKISGLVAPSNYEVSDIVIKTSDQSNSGSPPSQVYKTINTPMVGLGYALPKVYVTKGTQLELEYFHIESFTGTGGSKGFTARAWGAWARLEKLVVNASAPGPISITADAPNGPVTIYSAPALVAGVNTLIMDYSAWGPLNNNGDVQYGYLRDQAGSRAYHITYTGTLTLKGSTDEILEDDDYDSSGLTGANGTIITAGGAEQRNILVNLVDNNGYDVNEQIPVGAKTDLGSIVEVAPYMTDTTGNAYFTLNPGCKYGIAHVKIYTDPLATTPKVTEYVGIDSNVPASFAVVEGDGAKVPAGESQKIKVEVYDSCSNLVSDTHQQFVNFTYITATCGSKNKLSQVAGGVSHDLEQEDTDMGVAEVWLNTECQLCTHDVKITVPVLPGSPKTIHLYGVNGLPVKMKVTVDKDNIQADECVEATIEVVDECGNLVSQIPSEVGDEMEQWESIVRVSIEDPLKVDQKCWTGNSQTWISDSDFREEEIRNYWKDTYVQGKLNQGVGHVTICGCQGLGQYDIVAISDTIEEGRETVSVRNADPDCIEVQTIEQMLLCEKEADINVSIKDVCGNYWRNQGDCGDESQYCVNLGLSGTCDEDAAELETSTVCIDVGVGGPGYLEFPVELERLTDDCCELDITATKGTGCCGDFPTLHQCEDVSVLFHGGPSYMTTEFFKTRKICEPICPPDKQCHEEDQISPETSEIQRLFCYEQLHEELIGNEEVPATETVSEEVLDLFTVYDACGHIVKDYNGTVDVEIKGEDCASIYQVDHPLELEGREGWCSGTVQCGDLTQFGEAKCEETEKCWWKQNGYCSGKPDCTDMKYKGQCSNWGCTWIGGSITEGYYCQGTSKYANCNNASAPGGGKNQEICGEVGCTWTDTSTCEGDETTNNCAPYDKEQCLMVGGTVEESCEWTDLCKFEKTILKKLVIHNCKEETDKQWLPIEKVDIIVDKLAFQVNHEVDPTGLWLYVYLENEKTPGFQPYGYGDDELVGKAPVVFGGPTIMELEDSDFSEAWDNQREGGVIIRAGDSKDFYVVLKNKDGMIPCGTYDAEFLWYQDYNSPDLTNSGSGYPDKECGGLDAVEVLSFDGDGFDHCGPFKVCNGDGIIDFGPLSGTVEDGCINADNFNWIDWSKYGGQETCCGPGEKDARNDDYLKSESWKYEGPTPDYGFGDRFLYNLEFKEGQAWLKFRDLVAETVEVHVSNIYESGDVCQYDQQIDEEEGVDPNPEVIEFTEQPATQIKLINHDSDCRDDKDGYGGRYGHDGKDCDKTAVCEDEWVAEENAYLFNIQVTDGFDNPVGKEIEVEMEYCLKYPFGDWMVEDILWKYCITHGDEDVCDQLWMDKERCFTREDIRKLIEASEYAHGFENLLFGDFFGEEFSDWMEQYFMEAKVEFWDNGGHALPFDSHGHQVVMTDSDGQAQVYVTAQKTGVYKIIARPLALDGDWATVSFEAGIPQQLDLMAVPGFGVPADGEQEAMLFMRALDACGNIVHEPVCDVEVKVTDGEQVYISQDFECKNNYDGDVTGKLYSKGFLGETCLAVLSDLPQVATLEASADGLYSDTTQIAFQGAPVKLAITKIEPSDRLPADGQTGAWVTIEVQDKNGNRVTGYFGDGFSGDPGDPWGCTDYKFDSICIDLDDLEASVPPWFMDVDKTTYGWVNFQQEGPSKYCGDLMFGQGKIYVTYGNPDCNHGGTVNVKVWDDHPYQGQEFDENGIPVSVEATQLRSASSHIDFVDPASQWNLMADKAIALADGKSTVRIEVQVENPYMDVRQAVDGVVYIGGPAADGAVVSWNGITDSLNPTSARFVTDPMTGKTYLELTSTEPGKAEITVTGGDAYTCLGVDDVTLKGCLAWCGERLPFNADCLSLCISGDIGVYNCPTCKEYIPKFWCHYTSKEDLTPKTIEVEFLEVASKDVCLDKGWNFISVPYLLDISKDQLNEIFNYTNIAGNAYGWNAGSQSWVPLTGSSVLGPQNGYWIKAKGPECTTLVYATPTMPSIPTKSVSPGWNAVGLAWDSPITMRNALMSINNIYSNVIGWIAGLQKYAIPVANTGGDGPFETGGVNMEPKQGYWVWSTGSGTLAGLAA